MQWPMVIEDNCDTQGLLFSEGYYSTSSWWDETYSHWYTYNSEWEILRGNLEKKESKKDD
jgi:hypothetical protein